MAGIGSTPALIVGTAVGGAAAAAFEPALEVPRQEAWNSAPNRILNADLLARLVAQGGVDLGSAQAEAKREGYDTDKLDALVYLAQTVPGIGEATALWRRGLISDGLYSHVLVKEGLDQRYVAGIIANKTAEPIGLGDIGYAVVRGIVPAPSYVPVPVPAQGDTVPRYPVVNVDPEELAAKLGYSPEMLQIIIGRSGLSMAPVMAAQARFRGIIGPNDYLIAIGEGDLRTEWAHAVLEASRQILTADQYMEGALRGWTDLATGKAGAAKHGMTDADAQLLYQIRRRPLAPSRITQALARGGTFNPSPDEIQDPYSASVHQADLGPEWYDLAEHLKYTYSVPFWWRSMASSGALSAAEAEDLLLRVGNPPDFAAKVTAHFVGQTGPVADPHVAKAQGQLWTTLHRSYVAGKTDDTAATTVLGTLGVAAGAIPSVLHLWQTEAALVRKPLTAAQIKKAYRSGTVNPDTGSPWTQDEALAELMALGMSHSDALTFLTE